MLADFDGGSEFGTAGDVQVAEDEKLLKRRKVIEDRMIEAFLW